MEETTESDGELENDLECDEESDVEVFSWDRLLIEDDHDSEAMYFWVVRQLVAQILIVLGPTATYKARLIYGIC